MVQLLLESSASVNPKDRWDHTPLCDAVQRGHAAVAEKLSERGGEMGFDESTASGELCKLAHQGSVELLGIMLRCGVSVNAANYDKRTSLHVAASDGNLNVVELLLKHGADVNAQDRCGATPLRDALRGGHHSVARVLCNHGGQLALNGLESALTLCECAAQGKLESLKALIESRADPNEVDYTGRTPLHVAAAMGNKAMVQQLLGLGCRADVEDLCGFTAQQSAERCGQGWQASLWNGSNNC